MAHVSQITGIPKATEIKVATVPTSI